MPRLSTSRIITSLLFLFLLVSIIYINFSSISALHSIKTGLSDASPDAAVAINTPLPPLTPAQLEIKKFFRQWSRHLHTARPHIPPIKLGSTAQTTNGQHLSGERQPAHSYLHLPEDSIVSLAASHRSLLRHLRSAKQMTFPSGLFSGTGIVIVAGGEYFSPTLITLRLMRRTGCTLPAEVFLGSRSEYEPALCNTVLPALGAKCVILPDFLSPPLSPGVTHYQLKSLALIFSSFERVLYLDSDSIPVLNPTPLFTTKPFTDTGLVLWPDFWMATEDPVFYNISGVGGFPEGLPPTGSEAGQILADKKRHLTTLLLAAYYNVFGPGYYYELLSQGALGQGDKETFLAAALVLGNAWTRVQKGVEAIGYKQVSGKFKGSGMIQYHPGDDFAAQTVGEDGKKQVKTIRPAFIHANTPKMNAGHLVDEGDLFDGGKRVRLWGSKEQAVKTFGGDIERVVWKELVDVGCKLADVLKEWKGRDKLCERLTAHWKAVFENDI